MAQSVPLLLPGYTLSTQFTTQASCLQTNFHGSADNPSMNGTLCHPDIDLALSQRAHEKVDKYREEYAASCLRHAFLLAVVSTSGRIHEELLGCSSSLPIERLPSAEAATLCTQVVGRPRPREALQMKLRSLRYHTPRLCRIAGFFNTNHRSPLNRVSAGETWEGCYSVNTQRKVQQKAHQPQHTHHQRSITQITVIPVWIKRNFSSSTQSRTCPCLCAIH